MFSFGGFTVAQGVREDCVCVCVFFFFIFFSFWEG